MIIYHIAIAKTERGLSGGEVSMIALVKYFSKRKYKNVILTSSMGKQVYESSGLKEDKQYIEYRTFSFVDTDAKLHIFFSWMITLHRATKCIKNISFFQNDIIICHSIFFPDFIAAYLCKRKNRSV